MFCFWVWIVFDLRLNIIILLSCVFAQLFFWLSCVFCFGCVLLGSICFVDFCFVLARYVLAKVGVLAQLCFGSIVFFCFGCVLAKCVLLIFVLVVSLLDMFWQSCVTPSHVVGMQAQPCRGTPWSTCGMQAQPCCGTLSLVVVHPYLWGAGAAV